MLCNRLHATTLDRLVRLIRLASQSPVRQEGLMSFAEHWNAIVARAKSLQQAGELYAQCQSYHKEDS